ncbi:MAG TPA: hypothetical protein VNW92_07705 [Polyangiaceae bacterium]|nr:hypothetical protein [Polyangiaceae bacterium]
MSEPYDNMTLCRRCVPTEGLRAMCSLIAYASMALKNCKVTGSIGGAQVLTLPRYFPGCIFRRNHTRIHRDGFPDSTR